MYDEIMDLKKVVSTCSWWVSTVNAFPAVTGKRGLCWAWPLRERERDPGLDPGGGQARRRVCAHREAGTCRGLCPETGLAMPASVFNVVTSRVCVSLVLTGRFPRTRPLPQLTAVIGGDLETQRGQWSVQGEHSNPLSPGLGQLLSSITF